MGRKAARLAALALALYAAPAALIIGLNPSDRVSTDLTDIMPADSDADARRARELVRAHFTRNVMLVVDGATPGRESRERMRSALRTELEGASDIGRIWMPGDPVATGAAREAALEARWTLFFPRWLDERASGAGELDLDALARSAARELDAFLATARSSEYADELPEDPLLLVPSALETFQRADYERAYPEPEHLAVWIPVDADPMTTSGQRRMMQVQEQAMAAASRAFPESELRAGGIHLPAMESESLMREEVTGFNLASLVLVAGFLWLIFRRFAYPVLLLLPVISALLWGGAAALAVFGELHMIAIGLASVLFGVGVDYGIHLLARGSELGETDLRRAFRRVRRPLLTGALSGAAGFCFLLLTPIGAFRQVGVFVPVGLGAALFGCRFLLPALARPAKLSRFGERLGAPVLPVLARRGLAGAAAVLAGAAGWSALDPSFNDSIDAYRLASQPGQEAYEDLRRRFFNQSGKVDYRTTYAASARGLVRELEALRSAGKSAGVLPELLRAPGSAEHLESFLARRGDFVEALRSALEAEGFRAESFAPAFAALRGLDERLRPQRYERAARRVADSLAGPAAACLLAGDGVWASVYPVFEDEAPPGEGGLFERTRALTGDEERVSNILRRARAGVASAMVFGFAAIAAGLFWVFSRGRAMCLAAGPLLAASLPLLIVARGEGVTLLALIAAMLGFCLGLNYVAFATEPAEGAKTLSIRVSGITTLVVFGVLSVSSIQAIHQFGAVASLSVLLALALSEWLAGRQRRGAG